MNKSQLTEALAKAENITLKKAEMVVNAVFENIAYALVQKERIEIRGFGSFKVKFYNGYKGRNPKTGDLIKVDGKKLPFFKVARNCGNASIADTFLQLVVLDGEIAVPCNPRTASVLSCLPRDN